MKDYVAHALTASSENEFLKGQNNAQRTRARWS